MAAGGGREGGQLARGRAGGGWLRSHSASRLPQHSESFCRPSSWFKCTHTATSALPSNVRCTGLRPETARAALSPRGSCFCLLTALPSLLREPWSVLTSRNDCSCSIPVEHGELSVLRAASLLPFLPSVPHCVCAVRAGAGWPPLGSGELQAHLLAPALPGSCFLLGRGLLPLLSGRGVLGGGGQHQGREPAAPAVSFPDSKTGQDPPGDTEEGQGQRLRRPPEVGSEWTLAKPQGEGLRAGLMTGCSHQDLAGPTRGHSRSRLFAIWAGQHGDGVEAGVLNRKPASVDDAPAGPRPF